MRTIASLFERALALRHGNDFPVVLASELAGLPDMAHGGTVLALFDAIAGHAGPRAMRSHYRKRVPLGAPLRVTIAHTDAAIECRLFDESSALLVDGAVTGGVDDRGTVAESLTQQAGSRLGAPDPSPDRTRGEELPVSRTCFVCGTDNEVGLGARLRFDDDIVHTRWSARAPHRAPDGTLHPVAITALLDEAAFWLGALATGESGMTTGLSVTLHRDAAFTDAITIVGERSALRARADDPRYSDTDITAFDDTGRVVATATITFVAVRGAARKLATGMLAMNAPDTVRRVFPAYVRA